ncbi:MAG: hypothetical protein E6G55_00145 [Actinobacteria bacterium]|nr:MAG: hypothetical protein E6G55_00145 [Actinomycetota bacterium]
MARSGRTTTIGLLIALAAVIVVSLAQGATAIRPNQEVISESALLTGLGAGAAFPFIDTTPRPIVRAHMAVTDATTTCAAGGTAPANIQVLVGQAGVSLVNVMTASTNTGISTTPGQCVFHVTVRPGVGGVAEKITDIVIVNAGAAPLTGINTATASATVQ